MINFIKLSTYFLAISWAVLFIYSLISKTKKIIHKITHVYHILVCLLLIILFNPIRPFKYKKSYRPIVFTAAIYMFISLNLLEITDMVKKKN